MTQAIIYSGGINHPFEQSAPALAAILAAAGLAPRYSVELPEVLSWLREDPAALLVIHALRWGMTQHEKYGPDRPRWSLTLSAESRAAIAGHVRNGGGLVGLHTASICFDDWPEWRDILGGAWKWGQSHHPTLGPVQVRLRPRHFLARGLPDFALNDEVYSDLDLLPGIDVAGWAEPAVARAATASPAPPAPQVAIWTHRYGRGRVFYDSLGHDAMSLQQPAHRQLLQRAALWACGMPENVVEAAQCGK